MSNEIIPTTGISELNNTLNEIVDKVLTENDVTKTKDLVELFNWNMSKKNVARILKLNELLDDVTDQMSVRIKTKPDQYSHSDLIDYMKAVQGAIDTSNKNVAAMETTPAIVNNNNTQINVNVVDNFDRDARERILDAIKKTLQQAAQPITSVIETTSDSEKDKEGETSDE